MGLEEGFIKYIIFTPITIVGFISMYIFGGGIVTFFNTASYLFSGNFWEAFIEYFVNSALPPTSIAQVIFQVIAGTVVAGMKWFIAMSLRSS